MWLLYCLADYSVRQQDLVSLAVHSYTQRLHSRTFYNFGCLAGKINTIKFYTKLEWQKTSTDQNWWAAFLGFFFLKV